MMGATNPLDSAPGHDPRRFRARAEREHRARLGLARRAPHASYRCISRPASSCLRRNDARPGVALAAAPRDPDPARARVPRRRAALRRAAAARCRRTSSPSTTAAARRARSRRGAGETVLGVDTVVVVDGAGARQAGGRGRGARDAGDCWRDATHEVVSGLTLLDARRRAYGARANGCALPGARRRARIDDYVARGEWRGRAGATPSRRPARHSCRTSRDASSTWSACPSPCSSRCWARAVAGFPGEE